MKNIFTEHPRSVNETYLEHFKNAASYGFYMLIGSLACFVHAIFPFLFQKTGSNLLLKMTHHFIARTPKPEQRMQAISELVQQKLQETNASHE